MLVIWFGWFVCYCSVGFSKYMRHRDQANLHLFDPEPERTLHRSLREQRTEQTRDRTTMENNEDQNLDIERNEPQRGRNGNNGRNQAPRPFIHPDDPFMLLDEFVLPPSIAQTAIRRPPIQANNFELKSVTIQMLQNILFHGLPHENPNMHLTNFLEVCDTIKYNGVTEEALRLRLFPLSLGDRAKHWLTSQPPDSITTWNDLVQKFLTKFFPPSKIAQLVQEINTFGQLEGENLAEAWDRFQELLRKCPHHRLTRWMQVHTFYNGLRNATRAMIDASAGGALMKKTTDQAYEILEDAATNTNQWPREKATPVNAVGGTDNEVLNNLVNHVAQLTKQLNRQQGTANAIQTNPWELCEFCGVQHSSTECQSVNPTVEQAQYVSRFNQNQSQQQGPYGGNSYQNQNQGQGWRNNQNQNNQNNQGYGWRNNQNNMQSNRTSETPSKKKLDLAQALAQMLTSHSAFMNETKANMQQQATQLNNQAAQLRSLEAQMGQMANLLTERQPGSLPSNSEVNPRRDGNEHVKAVTLRSGKDLETKEKPSTTEEVEAENVIQPSQSDDTSKEQLQEKQSEENTTEAKASISVPYPQRLKKHKLDKQFTKFMDVFKKLHINIPFSDALEQMPSYVKFMKDILSQKRRLADFETVNLTEECSAILQRKLPQKLKDPGSFTIPCTIGNAIFERALCDLGASINLMPLSIFKSLGLGEARPTTITLQLADRSLKHPRGIIEDVLVKVNKFIFPADFIVLDMEEDKEIPIILGRPFLATGRAMIDVQRGELKLRVQEEEVKFNVFEAVRHPAESDTCFMADIVEATVSSQSGLTDPLETSLVENEFENLSDEAEEYVKWMDSFGHNRRKYLESLGEGAKPPVPSIEQPPKMEQKPLPSHLKYAYLGEESTLPVIISSSLIAMEEEKLLRVLRDHKQALGWSLADLKGIRPSMCMHRILLEDGHKPSVEAQRRLNPTMKEVVRKEVLKWLDTWVIYPISDSAWVSPVQVLPKKGGTTVIRTENNILLPSRTVTGWRICIDYRKLNKATRKDHFTLPFLDQMLDRLAGYEYYCFLDGYSGYNQIAIAPDDQEKTTFTCPYGTFSFRRMPFGLCNAPGTFQRCMMAIFSDMVEKTIEIFMDDFSVMGNSFDNCLENLRAVLARCEETNLVLNWEKCHFMVQEGIVLGHRISARGIEVDKAKIEAIEKLPPPSSVKGIRSFLGHAGFYRRFIKDISQIAKPLSNLLVHGIPFEFDSQCLHAFSVLKDKLISAPIVVAKDWSYPFELMCDASDFAIAAVLGQKRVKIFQVIYYASRTLNDAQLNYATTEKELLAIVFSFDKFRHI